MRWTVTVLIVGGAMFAQSAPPPCPANRPVDDIIAEAEREHSKKRNRNADPLPQIHCSWAWCIDASRTPPTIPERAPRMDGRSLGNTPPSAVPVEACANAMKMALEAAHNVEVGDYYFGEKNYSASSLRYQDALEEKPDDLAIHVRLGRAFEKLNRILQAIAQYKAAQKLTGPEKWSDEAKSALQRLQHAPSS